MAGTVMDDAPGSPPAARPTTLPDSLHPRAKVVAEPKKTRRLRPRQQVDDAEAIAATFHKQGFVIVEDVVDSATCDHLLITINKNRDWLKSNKPGNMRNRERTRYSLNWREWKFTTSWQYMLLEVLEGKVRCYLDAITGDDDSICIDRLGGDCVECGCLEPQDWHSDWSELKIGGNGGHEVALGISIAVTEVTEAMGPIAIMPADREQVEANAVACCMSKGSVLIRNIRVRHRGTANVSDVDRVLPGFTLLTRATLLLDHTPMQAMDLELRPTHMKRIPVWLRDYVMHSA